MRDTNRPPKVPGFLLRAVLPDDVVGEAVRGDLLEELHDRGGGSESATWWYWRQALSVCAYSLAGRLVPVAGSRPLRPHRFKPKKEDDEIMRNLTSDVRFALRGFLKRPTLAATALVTLALGIGANTAIFSVVHGVLLRPLPYAEPARVVAVWQEMMTRQAEISLSVPNFEDFRNNARSFSGMAAISQTTSIVADGNGSPERFDVGIVSREFFDVLGIPMLHGRSFVADEETEPMTRVVILAEEIWQRRFGGDPSIIGKGLDLEGTDYEIVGIAPRSVETPFFPEARLWIPYGPWFSCGRGCNRHAAIARLRDGVSLEQAQADMSSVAAALEKEYPKDNADMGAVVVLLHQELVGDVRPPLLLLLGAVGFVLLLACANVAHLFLVRATARRSEIAVRAALGASRGRVVRQLLTESTVLAVAAGTLGLLLAGLAVPLLLHLAPPDVPRLEQVTLDAPVLLFTLALALATGILFGAVPALRGTRCELTDSLGDTRGGDGFGKSRIRDLIVVGEVAVTLMLAVAAGLMVKSFDRLRHVDSGIRAPGVLTAALALPSSSYKGADRVALYDRLVDRLGALPGVDSAAATWLLPVSQGDGEWRTDVTVAGQPEPPPGSPTAALRPVTPGYFATIGIPLERGRDFTPHDDWDSTQVAVISAAMAHDLFAGEDPIGRQIRLGLSHRKIRHWEIVGVAGDVKLSGLTGDAGWTWYIPYAQARFGDASLVLRTSTEPGTLAGALRDTVAEVAPDVVVRRIRTMDDVMMGSIAPQRFHALLLALFAALATFLAAVGIYGVMAFAVAQRRRELGLRVALGARPGDLVRMVVGRALALTLIGVALGAGGALALSRVLESLLYHVSPSDPGVFAGVAVSTVTVATLASYLPARQASRVDPASTLRMD